MVHHEQPPRKSQGKSFKENDRTLTASDRFLKKTPAPLVGSRVKNEKMKNEIVTEAIGLLTGCVFDRVSCAFDSISGVLGFFSFGFDSFHSFFDGSRSGGSGFRSSSRSRWGSLSRGGSSWGSRSSLFFRRSFSSRCRWCSRCFFFRLASCGNQRKCSEGDDGA